MINFIYQKYARIDILVNNAGFGDYGLLELVIINNKRFLTSGDILMSKLLI